MIYEVGFNMLEEFEGEDGKLHKIPQFKDIAEIDLKEDLSDYIKIIIKNCEVLK